MDELERLRPKAKTAQPVALKQLDENAETRKITVGDPVTGEEPTALLRPKIPWLVLAALVFLAVLLFAVVVVRKPEKPSMPVEEVPQISDSLKSDNETPAPVENGGENADIEPERSTRPEVEDAGAEVSEQEVPEQETPERETPEPNKAAGPPPSRFVPPRPSPPPPEPVRRAVIAPLIVYEHKPELTPEQAEKCYGVDVRLNFDVGEDGKVLRVRQLGTADPEECGDIAIEAAKKYRFRPAKDIDGQPVQGRTLILMNFGEAP